MRTVEGADVGTVTEVAGAAGVHRLLVRRAGDPDGATGEIDVPLAESICVEVDPEQRVIVVDPPEGLLDLNRRKRPPEVKGGSQVEDNASLRTARTAHTG